MSDAPLFVRPPPARRPHDEARGSRTSDVRRPRVAAVAAAVAAVAVLLAWLLVPVRGASRAAAERAPGPLGRAHAEAGLACASCHGRADGKGAAAACTSCHGGHPSTRAAHAALAAKGRLGCTTCHAAHGGAEGVSFRGDGTYVRWSGDEERRGSTAATGLAGVTVPLVPTAACARCHDLARAADPVARCLSRGAAVSLCFDEHQTTTAPLSPAKAACARQHGDARFVAWDAARLAVHEAPALSPAPPSRAPALWLSAAALAPTLVFALAFVRRRAPRAQRAAPLAPPVKVRLPQIATSTCLGCYACVDACPFDVLEVERYVAIVARPDACCGAGTCEQACPNGSLVIAEGAVLEERPRVDASLESEDAPGVFLAGDLTGLPLIKNAIGQGVRAIDAVARKLGRGERRGDAVDVVIVGAGPAGLSAALRARELGLSFVVLEQGSVAASIRSFPRDKLVFDPPLDVPVEGALWLRESTKEELLAQWTRIVRRHALGVREGHRVTAVARDGEAFVVTAQEGAAERTFRGRTLLLAIGRRGTPRALEATLGEGADAKVSYALADARSFAGKRVLVVGLGDAAMEAACAIARQPGAEVTISYRGAGFSRGKARNVAEVKTLVAAGRVRLVLESRVTRVDARSVTLATAAGEEVLANDAILALLGGVPAWELVESAGVRRASAAPRDPSPPSSVEEGP